MRSNLWLRIEPLLPLPTSFNNLLGKRSVSITNRCRYLVRKNITEDHRMRVLTPSALLEACFVLKGASTRTVAALLAATYTQSLNRIVG